MVERLKENKVDKGGDESLSSALSVIGDKMSVLDDKITTLDRRVNRLVRTNISSRLAVNDAAAKFTEYMNDNPSMNDVMNTAGWE
jgi:hypothetical protein